MTKEATLYTTKVENETNIYIFFFEQRNKHIHIWGNASYEGERLLKKKMKGRESSKNNMRNN